MKRTILCLCLCLILFVMAAAVPPIQSADALDLAPIEYSEEEREFLASSRTLTALCVFSSEPYFVEVDGEAVGVVPDAMEVIKAKSAITAENGESKIGELKIDFVTGKSASEALEMIRNGEIDLVLDAAYSFDWETEYGYLKSASYFDAAFSMLKLHEGGMRNGQIAVRTSPAPSMVCAKRFYFYEQLRIYNSVEECVEAVDKGECASAIISSYMAERIVVEDIRNRYVSTALGSEPICIATNPNLAPEVLSILNKVIGSFEEGMIDRFVTRYTTHRGADVTFAAFFYRNPFIVFGIILAVILISLLVALLILREKRIEREHAQAEEEKNKNNLLSAALAKAERADEAKSQFLSRVSHELRTPLNAIIGFMTLAKEADGEQIQTYLLNSEIAAKQLLAVINDVLDMSAIESGQLKIACAPFNFKQLIHGITVMYTPQCEQKGVAFETKILTPIEDFLTGDRLRLNQILMNLIGNAVKFTAHGKICLSIGHLDMRGDKAYIRFEVSDTGCGMSEDMQKRMFKAFEQENAATAQKYGGSGLGLSIVKNLVNLMEGEISFTSEVGKGSTFTVDLPFLQDNSQKDVNSIRRVQTVSVLVVEEEQSQREYFASVFEKFGVRYKCVENGEEALKELAAQKDDAQYTVCLLDGENPQMKGVELTRRIRESFGHDIVIIIAIDYGRSEEDAKDAGADVCILKPVFPSALFDLFMMLTDRSIGEPEESTQTSINADFKDKHILLVEDNVMNRMVALGLLKKFGVDCEVAENGQIAFEMFCASPPGYYDAILMDIQMPVMDGYAATKAIRESDHPDAQTIYIIALTADAFNEDIKKALESKMNNHVSKPIEPHTLIRALEKAFYKKELNNK